MNEMDITGLTYERIKPALHIYRIHEIRKERNPNGTYHHVTEGVDYCQTPIGEFTENDWLVLALRVIEKEGDLDLFHAILEHVKNLPWSIPGKNGALIYAAECLIDGAYKAWERRGEFSSPN